MITRRDWLLAMALTLAALVGYLYAHRGECILCKGALGFIPKSEEVPNGG